MAGFKFPKSVKWESQKTGKAVEWTKKGQSVEGLYLGFKLTTFDKRDSYLLRFQGRDGKEFSIWEKKVLEGIRELKKGTPVRIVFLGMVKKGKRRYYNFEWFTA